MVRFARFGWHDSGPVGRELESEQRHAELDDEPELRPRRRPAARRKSRKKSSPIDRQPPRNDESSPPTESR